MIGTAQIKQLVICPRCESLGLRNILGEIEVNGSFKVLRFHKGETRIMSREFVVQCQCGEVVYQRGTYGTKNLW